ncbi:MAG: hypothetical protein VKN72_19690 [Nostocales cyanobacterium 94392]|nr:hypothetical protein [Nostocales cyanobacterium 94392]
MTLSSVGLQNIEALVDHFTVTDLGVELEIEVDSVPDGDFGDLYRVWKSDRLLGTFYESFTSNSWKAQAADSINLVSCGSAKEAQQWIVENYLNNCLI